MSIEIAVVADDLTGALDTSTPFALAGLRVAAATRIEGLDAALDSDAEVIVVSTASRNLPPAEAAARVARAASLLLTARPRIVFKKVDSRLKGNIAAETAALADVFGFPALAIAPAIPDQGRLTVGGAVTGHGVGAPVPIVPHFAATGLAATVVDASSDADLDRLVATTDWSSVLAVGARGLGAAFARRWRGEPPPAFDPESTTLFAIASRDPITEGQLEALHGVGIHDAPLGAFEGRISQLPAVVRTTGPIEERSEAVARRLAAAVAPEIERLAPCTLVMSGGDTALAILDQLGVVLVSPQGEAAPGLPWFLIERRNHPSIRAVVKSGGFGQRGTLAALLPAPE